MTNKIIYNEQELLNIEDRSIIHTLLIDTSFPGKELIINNFSNLKILSCCYTNIEKLEIKDCENLELLKITNNEELTHLEAQSASFKSCYVANLPKLKHLDIKDISSMHYTNATIYSIEIIATGIEVLNLDYCLNLAGLYLYNNTELKNIYLQDIGKLDCFYTSGNGQFDIKTSRIGVFTR